ncbi:MAG: hypothetical protein IK088_00575 [Lachnospiraceae bacterium]|nr:hypothetical protein [Lachnospiraceae bacterium]
MSSRLLLKALTALPAFIAYSVFFVGTILLITLVSRFVFKEKLGKYRMAGLGLVVASLVLLNL